MKDVKNLSESELQARASRGDRAAMMELADNYYYDKFGENREAEAFALYQKLVSMVPPEPKAFFFLGKCYDGGYGIEKDPEMAAKMWRKAAELGHADAQYKLGMYLKEHGDAECIKWYERSADQGNGDAAWELAAVYVSGDIVPENCALYCSWLKKSAELDNGPALLRLSDHYFHGLCIDGVIYITKDLAEYVRLLTKAAGREEAFSVENAYSVGEACKGLTLYCYSGINGAQDKAQALVWAERGAKSGNADCFNYARDILHELCPKDADKRLFGLASQAFDNQWRYALVELAVMYAYGAGTEKQPEKAMELLETAVSLNYPSGLRVRALWYFGGINGSELNRQKAVSLWQAAADNGDAESMRWLGLWYAEDGDDFRRSFDWFRKAIDAGDERSERELAIACQRHILDTDVQQVIHSHNPDSVHIDREVYDCLRELAEKGNVNARVTLMNAVGAGLYTDQLSFEQTMDWMRESADQGDTDAQALLGDWLCRDGEIPDDEGLKYLQMAVDREKTGFCARILGKFYLTGDHVPRDEQRGIQLLERASKSGDAEAQELLSAWRDTHKGMSGQPSAAQRPSETRRENCTHTPGRQSVPKQTETGNGTQYIKPKPFRKLTTFYFTLLVLGCVAFTVLFGKLPTLNLEKAQARLQSAVGAIATSDAIEQSALRIKLPSISQTRISGINSRMERMLIHAKQRLTEKHQ